MKSWLCRLFGHGTREIIEIYERKESEKSTIGTGRTLTYFPHILIQTRGKMKCLRCGSVFVGKGEGRRQAPHLW